MINYFELGPDKCLNEIVVAGSHDAGITKGGSNVQTQDLDIFVQAWAGVRFFDLRIAAAGVSAAPGEQKRVELKAFHADGILKKDEPKIRQVGGIGPMPVERTKLRPKLGGFGMGLEKMLEEAKDFVQNPPGDTEFLILKFDKCKNWMLIAEACTYVLHDVLYKDGGNLNTRRLRDLQGKVVVLFSPSGIRELHGMFGHQQGILGFKNLKEEGATYEQNFHGLQYYGKGGTSVNPFKLKSKLNQNVSKQRTLLREAKDLENPQVMGMMYWTTTGLLESIKKRNAKIWERPNIARMKQLWTGGLGDYIETHNPLTLPEGSPLVGPTRKRFMPNIVMIDFADAPKCQVIRELNDALPGDLARLGAPV